MAGPGFFLLPLFGDQLSVHQQVQQVHQLQAAVQSILLLVWYVATIDCTAPICHLPLVCRFSADILPLVEFEVDNQLTHEQIQSMLDKGDISPSKLSNGDSQTWTQKVGLNSETLEVLSNEPLLTEKDTDRFKIFNSSGQLNEATNLIVLKEDNLVKLDLANLIFITNRYGSESGKPSHRYFLNMMPEIGITACAHCNKVLSCQFTRLAAKQPDLLVLLPVLLQR